jgi:hypothetical protein
MLICVVSQYGKSLDWTTQQFTPHDVASVFRRYLTQMPVGRFDRDITSERVDKKKYAQEPVIPIDMYHDVSVFF